MAESVAVGSTAAPSKGFHIALWVLQVLLAFAFIGAGFMKAMTPMAELVTKLPWTAVVPEALTRFIGFSELLGGIGLVLPAATRIMPRLTTLAAALLVVVMVLALGFHVMRGEMSMLAPSAVLGVLSAVVAWGRQFKAPIAPRQKR